MEAIKERKSPFYPDQPVPYNLFVGRSSEIDKITQRGMGQVSAGKSVAFFLRGEYGIGKSSLANYLGFTAFTNANLFPIYVTLSGCRTLEDVAEAILQGTLLSGAYDKNLLENIKEMLGKYIGSQSFFGGNLTLHFEQLLLDAPEIKTHHGILMFLKELYTRVSKNGCRGIFLIFDELNGIAKVPEFAHFLKGLWDGNSMQAKVPLLFIMCGVDERRTEIIANHEPVNRIFDVVDIKRLSEDESRAFYEKAFDSARMMYEEDALKRMVSWATGYPKIMHIIGDTIYWNHDDFDSPITAKEAYDGVMASAEMIGRKYFEPNVLSALQSTDYKILLKKTTELLQLNTRLVFSKAVLANSLSETQKGKLSNFLSRMTALKAFVHCGRGEYTIPNSMIWMYLVIKYELRK